LGEERPEIYYDRIDLSSGQSIPPIPVAMPSSDFRGVSLAASESLVFVYWRQYAAGEEQEVGSYSADGGQTFSAPILIAKSAAAGLPFLVSSDVTVSGHTAFAVWDLTIAAPATSEVFFAAVTPPETRASEPKMVSVPECLGGGPKIAASDHEVFVGWSGAMNYVSKTANGGISFDAPVSLEPKAFGRPIAAMVSKIVIADGQ